MRLGVVMDPIAAIKPHKDTTLALLLAAQRRGWRVEYMELSDLYLRDGVARGQRRALHVEDRANDWWEFGAGHDGPLAELDAILMRKDPPFDAEFLHATHLLELAQRDGVLVVNDPAALRDCNEKLFAQWFPQCCPPTLVTRDAARLRAFHAEQGKVVLKPLDGMGGAGIFVLGPGDGNLGSVIEMLTAHGTRQVMAQRWLPAIAATDGSGGDKRILLVAGEPVPYALARLPAPGEARGNLAAGGRGEGRPLTARDRWIAAEVGPALRARGLLLVGLDVIGDHLTEINVTSPTCARELDAAFGLDIGGQVRDAVAAARAARLLDPPRPRGAL
jgi:glutathione synthase